MHVWHVKVNLDEVKKVYRFSSVVIEEADVHIVRERFRPAVRGAVTTDLPHLWKKKNTPLLLGQNRTERNESLKHKQDQIEWETELITIVRTHEVMEELWTVDHHDFTDTGCLPAGQVVPHPRTHWGAEDEMNRSMQSFYHRFCCYKLDEMRLTLIKF